MPPSCPSPSALLKFHGLCLDPTVFGRQRVSKQTRIVRSVLALATQQGTDEKELLRRVLDVLGRLDTSKTCSSSVLDVLLGGVAVWLREIHFGSPFFPFTHALECITDWAVDASSSSSDNGNTASTHAHFLLLAAAGLAPVHAAWVFKRLWGKIVGDRCSLSATKRQGAAGLLGSLLQRARIVRPKVRLSWARGLRSWADARSASLSAEETALTELVRRQAALLGREDQDQNDEDGDPFAFPGWRLLRDAPCCGALARDLLRPVSLFRLMLSQSESPSSDAPADANADRGEAQTTTKKKKKKKKRRRRGAKMAAVDGRTLASAPPDVIESWCTFLALDDLRQSRLVCRAFRHGCLAGHIWKPLHLARWPRLRGRPLPKPKPKPAAGAAGAAGSASGPLHMLRFPKKEAAVDWPALYMARCRAEDFARQKAGRRVCGWFGCVSVHLAGSSASQRHYRQRHAIPASASGAAGGGLGGGRFPCTVEGCNKSFAHGASLRRHRKKCHHTGGGRRSSGGAAAAVVTAGRRGGGECAKI